MKKLTKEQKITLITLSIVVMVGLIILNQVIKLYYNLDLVMNPCDLCEKLYSMKCEIPQRIVNLSEPFLFNP